MNIKGLAITPPILGRITIGRVIEKDGKRLPQKDDQFTLTSQLQGSSGWVPHPLDAELRKGNESGKLRSIPVRLLFDDPELNLRAEYTLFDRKSGRPACVGNGDSCRRVTANGVETLPCPAPALCPLAQGGNCKPYGRLNVCIGDEDELGTFIFRTTGFNSIRTLAARLSYFHAVSGGLLACMPLELKLRGKTTMNSFRAPIFFVDLTVREGMSLEQAITQAREAHARREEAGFDQAALDQAARAGFAKAAFEFNEDEVPEILEEFYPEDEPQAEPVQQTAGLKGKLAGRLQSQEVEP